MGFPGPRATTSSRRTSSFRRTPTRGARSPSAGSSAASRRAGTGGSTAADVAALVDARTRVVAVAWVAFHNGCVLPLAELGAFCRERGVLLVVDGIQGLGALPIDVKAAKVDVLCADAHKWLYGTEGGGVLFVDEASREKVPARALGWWNLKTEGEYLDGGATLYAGARRYEPGSLPTASLAALGASLDLLAAMEPEAIRARILRTSRPCARPRGAGLDDRHALPLALRGPRRRPPAGDARAWAKALEQRGVIVAPREGLVRFSPHAGNDPGEIARALVEIDAIGTPA